MEIMYFDEGRERHSHSSPSPPARAGSPDAQRQLYRSHTLRLNKPQAAHPLPHLDVLSLQSRRLVSQTREQIAAHEATTLKMYHTEGDQRDDDEVARKLEALLESVHLLLEPLQIPDLSHTGIFHESTSQLQKAMQTVAGAGAAASGSKLVLSSVDKESDVKLFYPTGAKKSNMRDYIKETIQRHLASTESCAELPPSGAVCGDDDALSPPGTEQLGVSASAPALDGHSPSPSSPPKSLRSGLRSVKKTAKASPSPAKHKKFKSPQKSTTIASAGCESPLLNPELTRQAKDIIAAIRANSSKINELMGS